MSIYSRNFFFKPLKGLLSNERKGYKEIYSSLLLIKIINSTYIYDQNITLTITHIQHISICTSKNDAFSKKSVFSFLSLIQ